MVGSPTTPELTTKPTLQSRGRKAQPNSFVPNLYKILTDQRAASVCTWDPTGTFFVVSAPDQMGPILKDYYKHDNWASFVRQLNTYGFWKKPEGSGYAIGHEFFIRTRPDLFDKIARRSTAREHCKPEGSSSEHASKRRRVESTDSGALQQLSHGALLVMQMQQLEDRINRVESESNRKDGMMSALANKIQHLEHQNQLKDARIIALEKRNPKQTKTTLKPKSPARGSPARGSSPLHSIHNQALSAALIAATGIAQSRYAMAPQPVANRTFCVPPTTGMPLIGKMWPASFTGMNVHAQPRSECVQNKDENRNVGIATKA